MTTPDSRTHLIAGLGLRPGWRVLDAGYGTGVLLPALAAAIAPLGGSPLGAGTVTGIDLNPVPDDRLESGARELVDAGTVTLRQADVQDLPDEDGTYDAVWMAAVLHHVDDPAAAVAELARVVRPGGIVAIHDGDEGGSFPFAPWTPALDAALRAASVRAAADGYGGRLPYQFHPHVAREIPGLMRRAGLIDMTVTPTLETDHPITSERADGIRRWLLSSFLERIGPYLASVDRDAFEALLAPTNDSDWLTDPATFLVRTSLLVTARRPA